MTKETAVVLPGILILVSLVYVKKEKIKSCIATILSLIGVLSIYLFGHFIYYGLATGPSYQFSIGKGTINILIWYFCWALSLPNILIDYVSPGLKISNLFFKNAGIYGYISIGSFTLLITGLILFVLILLYKRFFDKKLINLKYIILGIGWFIFGMVPLIIFPLHKLATEQAFSLVGLSFAVSYILNQIWKINNIGKWLVYFWLIIYLICATNSILLARKTHWIVLSSTIAENTFHYLKSIEYKLKPGSVINFTDGLISIPEYGSSRQVYYATGNGLGIPLLFQRRDFEVYFEDGKPLPFNKKADIIVDSSTLLGY
ncbi:MAG: hypothetical protein WCT77_02135 [Bacteroidota bacterium]